MKVIPVSLITAVLASSENANYLDDNLLDDHPKKLWKANASGDVTLTFTVTGGISSAMAIFNTNATSVVFEISDPNAIQFEAGTDWATGDEWSNAEGVAVTTVTNLDGQSGACLCEWPETNSTLTVTVTLSHSEGDIIQAGVAKAGKLYTYSGPDYGLTEGLVDYSIVAENSNGSFYIKPRDMVRVFSLSSNLERDTAFHEFIFSIAMIVKSGPAAWVVTNLDNSRWIVYARFDSLPVGSHSNVNRTILSFTLLEVT